MEFVELNTNTLVGPALNWAVALTQGLRDADDLDFFDEDTANNWAVIGYTWDGEGLQWEVLYEPSERWDQAGELIVKYGIELRELKSSVAGAGWTAAITKWNQPKARACVRMAHFGPTQLVAISRAVVATHLGDKVKVPAILAGL